MFWVVIYLSSLNRPCISSLVLSESNAVNEFSYSSLVWQAKVIRSVSQTNSVVRTTAAQQKKAVWLIKWIQEVTRCKWPGVLELAQSFSQAWAEMKKRKLAAKGGTSTPTIQLKAKFQSTHAKAQKRPEHSTTQPYLIRSLLNYSDYVSICALTKQ